MIWVGADDGTVQVSRDDGATWTDVTANILAADGAPPFAYYVSWVEASHFEPERAYVSLDGHWDDDYAPYIFVTEDLGATWRSISTWLGGDSVTVEVGRDEVRMPPGFSLGIPSATVNVIREHHAHTQRADRGGRGRRLRVGRPGRHVG